MRLALFDLDGTLLRGNSWRAYFWWALRRWPARAPGLLGWLALRRIRLIAGRTLREKALRPLRGLDARALAEIGRGIFLEQLRGQIRAMAREEIAQAIAEGYQPVLATGAFEFLAEPLAQELGITEIVATRLEFADGKCLGRIAGMETRGAAKAEAVRARFLGRAVEWERSRA
jgi:HAD superfamily phosphoserine phosphatase-like hydrolase